MSRKVLVFPYNPAWPQQFEAESGVLQAIFGNEVVGIHHFGSTSIPGMSAKPIIDILVEVSEIERVDRFNEKMRETGYTPKGENGIMGRRYFVKGSEDLHVSHVHCFQSGHWQIERCLNFRDYLMDHPSDAWSYSRLKEFLAEQFPENIDAYIEGKEPLCEEINAKARRWKER
jgi:GrpB-like predicted nucleotidyltransferase (UPF0157 family)